MPEIYQKFGISSPVSMTVISVAVMLIAGFLMTRITKKLKLPNVTAYIVSGILIGPFCLDLIPASIVEGMDFLSDIALAFIAFSTGEFFRLSALRKNGAKVVVITLLESVLASIAVFAVTFYLLKTDIAFSIVLAALAAATAPASTVMTIRQTGAKGDFVDTLLQVVALDDIVGLVLYSVAISVAMSSLSGTAVSFSGILKPIAANIGVLILGGVFGLILKLLIVKKRSTDNRLIISVAMLFAFCGICTVFDISPLLGCMSMGTVYINLTDDDKLFKQLNYFSPPILLLFFVRSGINFRLDSLFGASGTVGTVPLILIGVLYFAIRIIGKYAGAYLGCLAVGKAKKVKNYLGLALIPQAGVAIGLAALGARTLGGDAGSALQTVILSSSVLYELIGPACAKLALHLSGSYSDKIEDMVPVENETERPPLDVLIERIRTIQQNIPDPVSDEEKAFTEAAEEQYDALYQKRYIRPFPRRFH